MQQNHYNILDEVKILNLFQATEAYQLAISHDNLTFHLRDITEFLFQILWV